MTWRLPSSAEPMDPANPDGCQLVHQQFAGQAMRNFYLLSLLVAAACSSDVLSSQPVPRASVLLLTPDSTAVDTAADLQFEARTVWSDGESHASPVTFSTTGGTISATGLFRAGPVPGVFLVIAQCECGVSDTALVTIKVPLHAVAVSLLPAAATLDTGATVAFLPSLTWSDSADHPAGISYAATGGTISAVGIYQAGSTAGQYQAILTCDCGLADTADITIAINAPPPPAPARLTLTVAGLPVGFTPQVSVNGPDGFTRNISATTIIDPLVPGTYEVRANGVTVGSNGYGPDFASRTIVLVAGATDSVAVTYRQILFNGVPAHPRVWMTSARVAHLRTQAAASTPRWMRVRAAADGQVGRGTAYSVEDIDKVPDLCLAYLATSDVRYATRADAVLTRYAVEANDLKGDSGYAMRFYLPLVTMGLDWCYDGLAVATRQQVATWLMNRADWVWPQSNPSRASGWAVNDVGNNYWWGFMMTGPAALAAAGDDIGTGALSGSDRPTFHRSLALTKWTTQALPFLQGEGAGGAWGEGTNYESSWRLGSFVDAFATAGTSLTTPFLVDAVRWKLQSTMPGGKFKIPFGDQPRESDASLFTYDRMQMLYVVGAAEGTLRAQAYRWLTAVGQEAQSEFNATSTLADELLRYDPAQAAGSFEGLPRGYVAPGPGFAVYRQSWTDPNATVLAFESGPVSIGGHGARDANGLMIWKGNGWISATANIYSHSGIETQTQNYNNLTVGGFGQVLYGGNDGVMQPPVFSDGLVVFRGQAKDAYGYPNGVSYGRTVLSDYTRTVAYLPQQDVVVVVDRAVIFNPALPKIWRWHMKGVPEVAGNTFRLQNPAGDFRCFGSVLAPGDVALTTESFALGNGGGATSGAVAVSMAGRATDVVVTVLQCTNAQSAPFTATAAVGATEVAVTVGGRRVVVPLSQSLPVRLE